MNVLVLVAGAGMASAGDALRAVPGVGAVEVVEVPEPAGRSDVDPVLDRLAGRRLVVAGTPAALGDVLVRLRRRDELATTPVAFFRPGTDAHFAVTGVPVAADLVRDDHGGVLVEAAELGPWDGRRLGMRAYVDELLLADGEVGGLAVAGVGDGSLRATVRPGRRWRAVRAKEGRALQVSCAEAQLVVDGRAHPRPVTRRNWWVEPGCWLRVAGVPRG